MIAATAREIADFQHEEKPKMNSGELYTINRAASLKYLILEVGWTRF